LQRGKGGDHCLGLVEFKFRLADQQRFKPLRGQRRFKPGRQLPATTGHKDAAHYQ
jgi:hypothetical protein